MGEPGFDDDETPAWAREPRAWMACAVSALPISVVLAALGRWLLGPSPLWAGLYPLVFTLWVWRFSPWTARQDRRRL